VAVLLLDRGERGDQVRRVRVVQSHSGQLSAVSFQRSAISQDG
jgi:hypothetical protein